MKKNMEKESEREIPENKPEENGNGHIEMKKENQCNVSV